MSSSPTVAEQQSSNNGSVINSDRSLVSPPAEWVWLEWCHLQTECALRCNDVPLAGRHVPHAAPEDAGGVEESKGRLAPSLCVQPALAMVNIAHEDELRDRIARGASDLREALLLAARHD